MKKYITLLTVAAVIQLVLIVVTWTGGSGLKTQAARTTLLAFDAAEVDQIHIKDGMNEAILDKKDGKWQTSDGFPADQNKVKTLLEKLEGLKIGLPVATSTGALTRFKVAEDQYERYLQLKKGGDSVAELYLGTGAGARQSHARGGDQEAVYTVTMGSYDAPANVNNWQDKTVLKLDKEKVTAVKLGDLFIERDTLPSDLDSADKENSPDVEDGVAIWKIDPPTDGKNLDQEAVNQGLDKLLSLRFDSVLGKESKPEYGLDEPVLELTITHKDGKRTYLFAKLKGSKDYVLHVSDRDEYFKIASYKGKPVVDNISMDKWVLKQPEDDALNSTTPGEEDQPEGAEVNSPSR